MENKKTLRILIVRVGNIGDVLMVTPFLRKLKRIFPEWTLDFLTSPQGACVIEHNPCIDRLFIYRKYRKFGRDIKKFLFAKLLSRNKYGLCFVLELHPQYQKFVYDAAGPKARKVGFSNRSDKFLDQKKIFSCDIHVIENYLSLLKEFLGIEISEDDFDMDLFIPDSLIEKIKTDIEREAFYQGKYFVVHPGCTENWPYRGWKAEDFARATDFLCKSDFNILITGKKADEALIRDIMNRCDGGHKDRIKIILEKSFHEISYLIKQSQGVLCSDTGILHIARAFNVPIVGLFGPSNPLHTGFIGKGKYRYIRNDFKCGPCNYYPEYRYEDKKFCLDGKIPPCMNSIVFHQVQSALKEILTLS